MLKEAPKAKYYYSDAFDAYARLWYHYGRHEVSIGKADTNSVVRKLLNCPLLSEIVINQTLVEGNMIIKKTIFYLILFLSLNSVTSCVPPAQPGVSPVQHADPFYNINDADYPLLHLPLLKPIEAKRQDGRIPWRVFVHYGLGVSIPNSQEIYVYNIEELEKFAVQNGAILAYSGYVNKKADAYIQDNYYHWFVIIPEKEIAEGFNTEDEFLQYIQSLGIQDPDWQKPDEAYEHFVNTGGCLDWIPDCEVSQ